MLSTANLSRILKFKFHFKSLGPFTYLTSHAEMPQIRLYKCRAITLIRLHTVCSLIRVLAQQTYQKDIHLTLRLANVFYNPIMSLNILCSLINVPAQQTNRKGINFTLRLANVFYNHTMSLNILCSLIRVLGQQTYQKGIHFTLWLANVFYNPIMSLNIHHKLNRNCPYQSRLAQCHNRYTRLCLMSWKLFSDVNNYVSVHNLSFYDQPLIFKSKQKLLQSHCS